jgi:hypothetical protein
MKRSAKYYKENPEARKKKAATDKKINARPEQIKKRTELNKENRKRGTYGNGDKMDLSHEKGKLVKRPQSANRGNKSNTQGDKNARGKKRN